MYVYTPKQENCHLTRLLASIQWIRQANAVYLDGKQNQNLTQYSIFSFLLTHMCIVSLFDNVHAQMYATV